MRIHRSSESYDFFVDQTDLLKQQLEEAQLALRDAKNQAGIASIEGRRSGLESQVSDIESQIQSVEASISAARASLSARHKAVAELPPPLLRQLLGGAPSDGLDEMESQLFQLRVQQKEAVASLLPNHPRVKALRDQVKEVEDVLQSQEPERPQLVQAILAEELANVASYEAQRDKLQQQLAQAMASLTELNAVEVSILQQQRNIQQLESEYLAYVENKEQARMDAQLKADRISNLSVLQPATYVPDRISPRPAKTLLLGGICGCFLAGVLVLLSDRLDPTVHAASDLPVHVEVSELRNVPTFTRQRVRRRREVVKTE